MQVFDLTQLRNVTTPQTFQETAHYDRINSAHNIVINRGIGFAYSVGTSWGRHLRRRAPHDRHPRAGESEVRRLLRATPARGRTGTGYSHDAQCVTYKGPDKRYTGHEICLDSNETALGIADVTDKAKPKRFQRAAYPNVAYAHQGWLTKTTATSSSMMRATSCRAPRLRHAHHGVRI